MKVVTINDLVKNHFENSKAKNQSYSLRVLAKKIGISKSFAADLLNDRCSVSKKVALKILENLNVDSDVSKKILANYGKSRIKKSLSYEFNKDEFKLISEWYHYAILAIVDIKNEVYTAKRISELLQISEKEASKAIERLIRLKILEVDDSGSLKPSGIVCSTSDNISDENIKKGLLSNFVKAKESLVNDNVNIRDFTSVTFAGNMNQLEEAKVLIRKFQDDLINVLAKNKDSFDEVYNLSIQLFPLTNKQKEKINEEQI